MLFSGLWTNNSLDIILIIALCKSLENKSAKIISTNILINVFQYILIQFVYYLYSDRPNEPSLVFILKWGGELTPAGKIQAEELGKAFRYMYPGGQG